jgi:hypothetical protein
MNEVAAIESLTREMELTRLESAALTDALVANRHGMEKLESETRRLADLIEESHRRGFWRRLVR